MTERIAQIRQEAERAIAAAEDSDTLEQARIRFLGRKAELPNLLRRVAELPPEERAATGRAANEVRRALEQAIEQRSQELAAGELQGRLGIKLPLHHKRARHQTAQHQLSIAPGMEHRGGDIRRLPRAIRDLRQRRPDRSQGSSLVAWSPLGSAGRPAGEEDDRSRRGGES